MYYFQTNKQKTALVCVFFHFWIKVKQFLESSSEVWMIALSLSLSLFLLQGAKMKSILRLINDRMSQNAHQ
jgi:hypothetical protein